MWVVPVYAGSNLVSLSGRACVFVDYVFWCFGVLVKLLYNNLPVLVPSFGTFWIYVWCHRWPNHQQHNNVNLKIWICVQKAIQIPQLQKWLSGQIWTTLELCLSLVMTVTLCYVCRFLWLWLCVFFPLLCNTHPTCCVNESRRVTENVGSSGKGDGCVIAGCSFEEGEGLLESNIDVN